MEHTTANRIDRDAIRLECYKLIDVAIPKKEEIDEGIGGYMTIPGLTLNLTSLEAVLDFVSTEADVSIELLKSKNRTRHIVQARHMFLYLSKKYTGSTFNVVGKMVKRDHATSMYAYRNVVNLRDGDPDFGTWSKAMEVKFKYKFGLPINYNDIRELNPEHLELPARFRALRLEIGQSITTPDNISGYVRANFSSYGIYRKFKNQKIKEGFKLERIA